MSIVYHTVQDGIRDRGVSDHVMPLGDGQLAGHDRRGQIVPIFKDLQKVSSFRIL